MNTTRLVAVPEGGDALDVLATRYRAALDKVTGGRAQWIEGTLELAAVMLKARELIPEHREYSRWITRNQLEHLSPNDRRALAGIGEMHRKAPSTALKLLGDNLGLGWRVIWEKKRANMQSGTLIIRDKGTNSARGHLSGSQQRKRKREPVIPAVMRDDYVPGARAPAEPPPSRRRRQRGNRNVPPEPRPERKAIKLKALTREQVDPDFVGTPLEFATKYGHVNLQTKQQIEHHKGQEELMVWLGLVSDHDRTARLLAAAAVDPETLRQWMSKPAKAEKLRTWFSNIERACESLRKCL